MSKALARVADAVDLETFLICKDEEEAKQLSQLLAQELNLRLGDIVFLEHRGWGARVRLRTYIHRPGDHYQWLQKEEGEA